MTHEKIKIPKNKTDDDCKLHPVSNHTNPNPNNNPNPEAEAEVEATAT